MAVLGVAFTSCSKDIAFDSEGVEKAAAEKLNAEYRTNFEKKYGAINPSQTWDFATMTPVYSLPSTATRAGETPSTVELVSKGSFVIDGGEGSVFDWLRTNMPAGQNHTQVGSPFKAVLSRNTFIVAPFYQGCATYFWELWVNINGKDYKIWEKYDNLLYQIKGDDATNTWRKLTKDGLPAGVTKVQAPTFTYKATEGSQLFFFMKVWPNDKAHEDDPDGEVTNVTILSSLENGNMRALQSMNGLPKPANVPDDYFSYLIGCEDGAPDVGTTDDFDFNDVVVDVSNVWTKKITRQENASTGVVAYHEEVLEDTKRQEAIVRAAGGIYDFKLTIGNKEWRKKDGLNVGEMLNTGWGGSTIYTTGAESELAKFAVTGWDKDNNNISLTVYRPDAHNSNGMTIKFPKRGDAPMIIAVDENKAWMTERIGAPASWFTTE